MIQWIFFYCTNNNGKFFASCPHNVLYLFVTVNCCWLNKTFLNFSENKYSYNRMVRLFNQRLNAVLVEGIEKCPVQWRDL